MARERITFAGRRRRIRVGETLEPRQLLAGDTVTLVADRVAVHQNGAPVVLSVLDNDQFGDSYTGPREISAVSFGSEGGQLQIADDRRSIVYAPPADFFGEEQFTYFVDGSFFTTVKVDVQSPLRADKYSLRPDDQWHTLNVLQNDPFWADYDGARRITLVSVTTGESEVSIAADGQSLLYRPSEQASGTDHFLYIVDQIYSVDVTISIPETLLPDTYEVLQNTSQQRLDVLANDPFWPTYDGPRHITFASSSQNDLDSTIEIAADGKSLLYTPPQDQRGFDSLFYVVDGRFEQWVSVDIQRPVVDDYDEIDINSQNHPLDVLSNDQYYSSLQRRYIDVVDRVTAVGPSAQGGNVQIQPDGRGVAYSAPLGFAGTDTFTYTADNRFTATVTVNITRPVRDDFLTAYQDTPNQRLSVLQNDFVGDGYTGPRQLTSISDSEQQAEMAIAGSVVRYTPPDGYVGHDAFSYTVDDTLDASVTLNVVPLAQYDSYNFCSQPHDTYTLDVLRNDFFQRGYAGPAIITSATVSDGQGTVAISPDGHSLQYRPGAESWARVDYTVDGKYDAQAFISRENHLRSDEQVVDQNSAPVQINVLANDFPDYRWGCPIGAYQGTRQITSVTASAHGGSVSLGADGRSLAYAPPADFYGTDQFSYVVDGTMEATVQVQVIRRVRDDQVRVRPGATDTLAVVANDLFGADYSGAQKITAVTPSTIGASVGIASDGRHLLYTAPAGFSGSETLTYTVDGKLKAQVEVNVRADNESPFSEFGSLTDFQDFLIQDALKRYEGLFGQPAYFYAGENAGGFDGAPEVDVSSNRDHSETNVQVAGIDEADIVEFDSDYVYFLTGNDVVILDAWPADQLHEVSRTPIVGSAIAQYLHANRLTVISQNVTYAPWPEPMPWEDAPTDLLRPFDIFPYQPPTYETIVTVLDVSDRAEPKLVQRTTMEGQYIESRGIGDYVYLAVANTAVDSGPRIIPPSDVDGEPHPAELGRYETQEEYLARVRANLGEFVDEALPNYESVGADGQLARSGLMHEPEDIFRPLSDGAASLVSLVSINASNSEPGLTGSSGVYTNGATQIYASVNHFYIFENGYQAEDGSVTRIMQFDWNQEDGSARFSAAGLVPGNMLNQFSADEYQDHLRIVTTVNHSYSGNWTSNSENDLFVLHDDGGTLEFTGSLQNLGLGESAQSVRFMGPRAFLVTFRSVDPLFGLDVSDPTQPTSVGHLTLPGFSSYMQLIDDNHLLTVGRNTPTGAVGPAQVSLFDVTNLAQPVLVDEYTMERFSQTEATADHHAFGYFAAHDLLAVPSIRSYVVRTDEDQDGFAETRKWVTEHELMVFRIDVDAQPGTDQAVQLLAEITHDSPVRRSGYIDDKLFSIADNSIHVVDVDAPDTILATAAPLQREPVDPLPDVEPNVVGEVFRQVQSDLAARLSVASGAAMPVVAEQGPDGWKSVVRVDDVYYRYQGLGDSLQLTGVGFQFSQPGEQVSWQNPLEPADVNGDGQVAPNDVIQLINQLAGQALIPLANGHVLRQIEDVQQHGGPYWDVNGDGQISPLDVLSAVNRLNASSSRTIDTGSLREDDPATLNNTTAVDAFYDRVRNTVGDANLDGRFDSADLIQVFQRGKYEDTEAQNAVWDEGDWDGDGDFTTSDIVLAFTYGTYEP